MASENCSICLSVLEQRGGQPIFNPGCGHDLHFECFSNCLAGNISCCPLCRAPFPRVSAPPPVTPSRVLPVANTLAPDDRLPATRDSSRGTAGLSSFPPPTLTWTSEDPSIDIDEKTTTSGIVSVKACSIPDTISEVSVDVIVVVDISGSMQGSKISAVKDTLHYMVSAMTSNDRMCIITFSNQARKATNFWCCGTESNSSTFALHECIDGIRVSGCTAIHTGLKLALDTMENRVEKNSSSGIILLSDGEDNNYFNYDPLVQRAERLGAPIFTYGFGVGHDDSLLSKIAGNYGTFTYVNELYVFQEAFGGCLGGIKSTVYLGLELHVEVPQTDKMVKISDVQSTFKFDLNDDKTAVVIKYGDLFADERRSAVLAFEIQGHHIPPAADCVLASNDDAILLGQMYCTYTGVGADEVIHTEKVKIEIKEGFGDEDAIVNTDVTRERLRFIAAMALQSSMSFLECGQTIAAVECLEEAQQTALDILLTAHPLSERAMIKASFAFTTNLPDGISEEDWGFYAPIIEDLNIAIARIRKDAVKAKSRHSHISKTYQTNRATYTSNADTDFFSTSRMQAKYSLQSHASAKYQASSSHH